MPRTGENIYKRKDGRWEGRYIKKHTASGKIVYGYLYARSYRDVKEKLTIITQRTSQQNEEKAETYPSFKNLCNEWLVSRQPQLKESTYNKYRNLLNCYVIPEIGTENILFLDYKKLEIFSRTLLIKGGCEGTGLSPKTVSDIFSLIRNILQYATDKGTPPAYNGRNIMIRQDMKEMRVLSRSEHERLCQYLYASDKPKDIGLLICLFTGVRIGEICALKWEDISPVEQTLSVHQSMQRIQLQNDPDGKKTKILISTPKSQCSIRTIPLAERLAIYLLTHRKSSESYVLTGTTRYVEPRSLQNHFKKVMDQCEIPDTNFHCLRHSFATRCIETGFDIKSLSEILGHSTVNITMNRYVHPSMELKRENMNRLTDLFSVS